MVMIVNGENCGQIVVTEGIELRTFYQAEMEFWPRLNFDYHVKIIVKLQKQNR